MRPAQFGTQCVPNWKLQEKRPHIPQIAFIKPPAEFASQGVSQIGQQPFAVSCSRLTSLLEFHDVPANFPIRDDLGRVGRAQHLLPCVDDQVAQGLQ